MTSTDCMPRLAGQWHHSRSHEFFDNFTKIKTVILSHHFFHKSTGTGICRILLLLPVFVLLAIGSEALGLQELGSSFSLAEGA